MLASIGGFIFESVDKKLSLYNIIDEYVDICKSNHNSAFDNIKNSTVPPIEFKSIGLKLEGHGGSYIISGNMPKSIEEVKGTYKLVVNSDPYIGFELIENISEAYDERDGSTGLAFEVMFQLCRYCQSYYSELIDDSYVLKEEVLPLSGAVCSYKDGIFKVSGIDDLDGSYVVRLTYKKRILCTLQSL